MQKMLPSAPPPPPPPHHRHRVAFPSTMTSSAGQSSTDAANSVCGSDMAADDERGTKRILKETVDAVVNSFAKHTREFGRGEPFKFFTLL